MGHYKPNVRDLKFNLFETLGAQDLLGSGRFSDIDRETAEDVLDSLAELASDALCSSFADADRNPPVFDPEIHSVRIPDSLKKDYRRLEKGEWARLWLPADLGGFGMPPTVQWAAAELLLGANPPWTCSCRSATC